MSIFKKIVLAATALLAYSLNIFSQNTTPYTYVYTSVEDFNYETLTGTLKIESFVKDDIPNTDDPKPLDLVFVIDVSGLMNHPVMMASSTPIEQTSRGYSYNDIGNQYYYYKHTDGKYYEVHALYDSNGYYIGIADPNGGDGWLLLSGTGIYSEKYVSGVSRTDKTIWTGVLYKYPISRLDVVKQATQDFVDKIAAGSSDKVDNKIALVQFSSNNDSNSKVVKNLLSMKQATNVTTLKNSIEALSAGGGTYIGRGVNKALGIIQGLSSSDLANREQVVIVLTDGDPSSTDTANSAVSNSKTMKSSTYNTTVYTIGILENLTSGSDTDKMMNNISSNYPNASTVSSNGGTRAEGDYFFNSPDGSAVSSIFSHIEDMVNPAHQYLGTETEVKNEFEASVKLNIPSGVTNIEVYTADCTAYDSSKDKFTFDDPVGFSGLSIDLSDDKKNIETSGFDYSANWCGLEDGSARGKELILKIPFIFTPTADNLNDDELDLNDEDAGMYKDDELLSKAKFLSNSMEFAKLIIEKEGLLKGESAIFEIVRGHLGSETADVPVNRIVLTGTAEDGSSAVSYTVPFLNPAATYKVTERTDWSWTYNPQDTKDSGTGFVTKSQDMTEVTSGTTAKLTFKNTKYSKNKLQKNSEDIK